MGTYQTQEGRCSHFCDRVSVSGIGVLQEDTAEYGARDDADPKGMQRVVDELLEKVRIAVRFLVSVFVSTLVSVFSFFLAAVAVPLAPAVLVSRVPTSAACPSHLSCPAHYSFHARALDVCCVLDVYCFRGLVAFMLICVRHSLLTCRSPVWYFGDLGVRRCVLSAVPPWHEGLPPRGPVFFFRIKERART